MNEGLPLRLVGGLLTIVFILHEELQQHSTSTVSGVIVDGSKKRELSATRRQSRNELDTIDSFNTKTCGISDPNVDEHEFVNMAREGQFPWIVSIQLSLAENKSPKGGVNRAEDLHFCSGSFISDKWILSAAHCFTQDKTRDYLQNNKLKIVAGSNRVLSRHPLNRNLTIERVYTHSKFNASMPIGFDVALVELRSCGGKGAVKMSQKRVQNKFGEQNEPFMNTICLPRKHKHYKHNETARVAGWGLSKEGDIRSMPSKLLTTDILIKDLENCTEDYVKLLKSNHPKEQSDKHNDFICASYKNTRDTCQSDSGGPLMEFTNNKAIAVGIVSYGISCATKGVPGLYTRTSAFLNWIEQIVRNGKSADAGEFNVIEREVSEESDDDCNDEGKEQTRAETASTTTSKPLTSNKSQTTNETTSTEAPEVGSKGTRRKVVARGDCVASRKFCAQNETQYES